MKKIVIDLISQSVTAYKDGKAFHSCECVSGDASHRTPRGVFHINRKAHPYSSHKYKVPMNYAMFFTNTGEALHQYHGPAPWVVLRAGRAVTDLVGSHGCVRLQQSDAMKLYGWGEVGTLVEVR